MHGFGASIAFSEDKFTNLASTQRDSIFDLCFGSKGAALNIMRVQLNPQWDYINWNSDVDKNQYFLMIEAQKRADIEFISSIWSPPAQMKQNGKISPEIKNDPNNLLKDSEYLNFVDYISRYVKGYSKYRNIKISYLSPQNEPSSNNPQNSCFYSSTSLINLIKTIYNKFEKDSVNTAIMAPECNNWTDTYRYNQDLITVDSIGFILKAVSTHGYGNTALRNVAAQLPLSIGIKEVWQTEVCETVQSASIDLSIENAIKWATMIQSDLILANCSAWLFWQLCSFNSTDETGLLYLIKNSIIIPKRYWTLANFSKYIKPGYQNISIQGGDKSFRASAFLKPDKSEIVIVMVNSDTVNHSFTTILPSNCSTEYLIKRIRTSKNENLSPLNDCYSSASKYSETVPALSVTTFIIQFSSNSQQNQLALINPPDKAENQPTSLVAHWQRALGADSYNIIVVDETNTDTFFLDKSTTDTFINVTNLVKSSDYYWRVIAKSVGQIIACSDFHSFSTLNRVPDVIQITKPLNKFFTTANNLTFSWKIPKPSVDKYELQIATDPLLKNLFFNDSNISTYSILINKLPNSLLWWRVRGHNESGWGEYTQLFELYINVSDVSEAATIADKAKIYYFPNEKIIKIKINSSDAENRLIDFQIFDLFGNLIGIIPYMQGEISDEFYIDCSKYAAGAYFVNIKFQNMQYFLRTIIY